MEDIEEGDPIAREEGGRQRIFLLRAHHEAAHAVVARHLGWPVIRVEAHPLPAGVNWEADDVIEPEGGGMDVDDAWVEAQLAGPDSEARIRERMQICLAGAIGEGTYSERPPEEALRDISCISDWMSFSHNAIAVGVPPDDLAELATQMLSELIEMIDRHGLDGKIRALAEQLVELRELSGKELIRFTD